VSRGYQSLEIEAEEVRLLMNGSKNKEEFRRYQSVYLRVAEKMPTSLIAKITGLSKSHIHSVHSLCRTKGLASLSSSSKGGRRRSYLSMEEEKALLSEIEKTAVKGGVVEIGKVHKLFEEKVGTSVARYTAYRLLHRQGWRKVAPRPYHPKQKAGTELTFKKTDRLWSKMQKQEL
jgi:transposase